MFMQKRRHYKIINNFMIYSSLLIFICSIQIIAGQYNCVNRNGSNGYCMPMHQCVKLLATFKSDVAFVKKMSLCTNGGIVMRPFVCCSPAEHFKSDAANYETMQEHEIRKRQRRAVVPNFETAVIWGKSDTRANKEELYDEMDTFWSDRWKEKINKTPNHGTGFVWDNKWHVHANAKPKYEPGIVWSHTGRSKTNKKSSNETPKYEAGIVWSDSSSITKQPNNEPNFGSEEHTNYEPGIVWSDSRNIKTTKQPRNETSFGSADKWNVYNNEKPIYEAGIVWDDTRKRQTKVNNNYEKGIIWGSTPFKMTNSCINPNRKTGTCQSIYDCQTLMRVLQSLQLTTSSTSQRTFLQQSQCQNGFGRTPFVCCTPDQDFIRATTTTPAPAAIIPTRRVVSTPSNGMGNVLPEPPRCGPQTLSDKIYNGNDTALDQYPWMVLLEYVERSGRRSLNCGGSLINQRYVLTAAHCVVGQIESEIGPLARVRLGEYDISSEIDCINDDCNKKVQELEIEQVIVHPEFNPRNANRYNDIALLRLNADVEYNDFIRPVCLPLANARVPINVGENLIVAGWGRTLLARQSNLKKQLAVPVNDFASCQRKFTAKNINLIESQLCAGGEFGKDSCDGDSGGPLMRESNKQRWYLEGIVSFGNRCGLEGWPGVYTRVADYMDWIQQNLRP